MFGLDKYKDIFGKPKQGVHKYRLFDLAIVDVFMTVVFIVLMVKYTAFSWYSVTLSVIFAMFFFHHIFGVETTTEKMLRRILS